MVYIRQGKRTNKYRYGPYRRNLVAGFVPEDGGFITSDGEPAGQRVSRSQNPIPLHLAHYPPRIAALDVLVAQIVDWPRRAVVAG
jgi:hypothetical protein